MSTTQEQVQSFSLEAAADLSANQFRWVKQDSNGRAVAAAAATDLVLGVQQNKPSALGQETAVAYMGVAKVVAGAAVAARGRVTSDASARAITAATGNMSYGIALDTAAAAGELIRVLLFHVPVAAP